MNILGSVVYIEYIVFKFDILVGVVIKYGVEVCLISSVFFVVCV